VISLGNLEARTILPRRKEVPFAIKSSRLEPMLRREGEGGLVIYTRKEQNSLEKGKKVKINNEGIQVFMVNTAKHLRRRKKGSFRRGIFIIAGGRGNQRGGLRSPGGRITLLKKKGFLQGKKKTPERTFHKPPPGEKNVVLTIKSLMAREKRPTQVIWPYTLHPFPSPEEGRDDGGTENRPVQHQKRGPVEKGKKETYPLAISTNQDLPVGGF